MGHESSYKGHGTPPRIKPITALPKIPIYFTLIYLQQTLTKYLPCVWGIVGIQYHVSKVKGRKLTSVLDTGYQEVNEHVLFPHRVRKNDRKEGIWPQWLSAFVNAGAKNRGFSKERHGSSPIQTTGEDWVQKMSRCSAVSFQEVVQ